MGKVIEFRRPPEQIDVVVVYYNHLKYWTECIKGLQANWDKIRKVYVVTDGPWDLEILPVLQDDVAKLGLPVEDFEWVDFDQKLPHGAGRALNTGLAKAGTAFVLLTTAKQRIREGYIAKLLTHAKPKALVEAPIHNIYPWPDGNVVKMDYALEQLDWAVETDRVWKCARNGGTLIDRELALELGGFDEEFGKVGYGFEDYEFALRWLYAGGTITWEVETFSVQELDIRPPEERTEKQVKPEILHLINPSGIQYYNGRLHMFATVNNSDFTAFNVGHAKMIDSAADCTAPEKWIADRSLRSCTVVGPDLYMPPEEWPDWIKALAPKLAPGGVLTILSPDARKWEDLVAETGLVLSKVTPNVLEAFSAAEIEE